MPILNPWTPCFPKMWHKLSLSSTLCVYFSTSLSFCMSLCWSLSSVDDKFSENIWWRQIEKENLRRESQDARLGKNFVAEAWLCNCVTSEKETGDSKIVDFHELLVQLWPNPLSSHSFLFLFPLSLSSFFFLFLLRCCYVARWWVGVHPGKRDLGAGNMNMQWDSH